MVFRPCHPPPYLCLTCRALGVSWGSLEAYLAPIAAEKTIIILIFLRRASFHHTTHICQAFVYLLLYTLFTPFLDYSYACLLFVFPIDVFVCRACYSAVLCPPFLWSVLMNVFEGLAQQRKCKHENNSETHVCSSKSTRVSRFSCDNSNIILRSRCHRRPWRNISYLVTPNFDEETRGQQKYSCVYNHPLVHVSRAANPSLKSLSRVFPFISLKCQ